LVNEVGLLAWKHRSESPVVVVTTSPIFDAEGAATQVSVMPRSFWDEDPRFLDTFPEGMRGSIRMAINGANCFPDARYVLIRDIRHSVQRGMHFAVWVYANGILRGVEFVDALTSAATTPEDLAAAIAWCKDMKNSLSTTQYQLHSITDYCERQAAAHGPSRALCNQVAYCMMHSMSLEFRVRLQGLCGATHLTAGRVSSAASTRPIRTALSFAWTTTTARRSASRLRTSSASAAMTTDVSRREREDLLL
jgi:hypothetical protein